MCFRDILLIALCSLVMGMIGYATIIMGVAAPLFVREAGIPLAELGPIFSAVAIGGAGGAMAASFIDRRLGKKRTLALALVLMGAGLALSALTTSTGLLILLRALTGFGTGIATPLAMAIAGIAAPAGNTARMSSIVAAGAPAGTFLTGLVGGFALEPFGWRPLFVAGGMLCAIIVAAVLLIDPQNVDRRPDAAQTAAAGAPASLKALLGSARFVTLLMIAVALASSIAMYVIGSWLPTILNGNGLSVRDSSLALALFTIGGSVGAILVGRMLQSDRPFPAIALAYLVGALGVAALSFDMQRLPLLAAALFAGIWAYGAHMSLFSLMNIIYREEFRLLALSGLVVLFRIGGFLGPLAAGLLLWLGLKLGHIMAATSALLIITGAIMLLPGWWDNRRRKRA